MQRTSRVLAVAWFVVVGALLSLAACGHKTSGTGELPGRAEPPAVTTPIASSVKAAATSWHERVNELCHGMIESAELNQQAAALIAREKLTELSADAPGAVERLALVHAAAALGSDQTRADFKAMDSIGHELERAGLETCGSMFISG
jgi:predicted small lipoprotein YifL